MRHLVIRNFGPVREADLELAQKPNGFGTGTGFVDIMAKYYKMSGYVHADTYIAYETDHLRFSYDHARQAFDMQWKPDRWLWRRQQEHILREEGGAGEPARLPPDAHLSPC